MKTLFTRTASLTSRKPAVVKPTLMWNVNVAVDDHKNSYSILPASVQIDVHREFARSKEILRKIK